MIERIKLPDNIKVGAISNTGFNCLVGGDELTALYWGAQYRKGNPAIPFIYAPGSYCESSNGQKLMTMAYYTQKAENTGEQVIVLFDKEGRILRSYKGNICRTVGNFGASLIVYVEQGRLNMFCLSGDAGYTAFNVYQASVETLIPKEFERNTAVYDSVRSAVEKLNDIDFSDRNLF